MKKKVLVKGRLGSILVCAFLLASIFSATLYAQDMKHIVQKGDTLWSICEKYYGNADLWPKLWQMNPYITNPHLLEPGDVVVLSEKPPAEMAETRPPPWGMNWGMETSSARTMAWGTPLMRNNMAVTSQ